MCKELYLDSLNQIVVLTNVRVGGHMKPPKSHALHSALPRVVLLCSATPKRKALPCGTACITDLLAFDLHCLDLIVQSANELALILQRVLVHAIH